MSDQSNIRLTKQQKSYAALDAWILIKIFEITKESYEEGEFETAVAETKFLSEGRDNIDTGEMKKKKKQKGNI